MNTTDVPLAAKAGGGSVEFTVPTLRVWAIDKT
jgi:hypothetical protein